MTACVAPARVWARRLTVLVVVLGLGVLFAPGARAGGPTSVLVTSPSSGEAAAVYSSDAKYNSLEGLLGPAGTGDRAQPRSLDSSVGTRQINVTWMALDLQPVRTDRVFPGDDPDTVWIHTAVEVPATYRGHWHRAAKPRELIALFGELGLMGRPSSAKGGPALFPRPWESEGAPAQDREPAAEMTMETAPAAETETSGTYARLDHWWWAVPGLAVGAALTLAALRSTAARREPGQRQELLDR